MVPQNSFEHAREQTGKEAQSMLGRLEKRVEKKLLDKNSVENAIGLATRALVAAKDIFAKFKDAHVDFTSKENLAKMTNAWHAWGEWGEENFFMGGKHEGLRKALAPLISKDAKNDLAAKYARQIWRTEMVSFLIKNIQASERQDKADAMLALMGSQKVTKTEDEPYEAINAAKALDPKLRNIRYREDLVEKMEKVDKRKSGVIGLQELMENTPGAKEIKVVVGGSLFTVEPVFAEKFELKNVVWARSENRIYAQMSNGCKGNLVIIELKQADRKLQDENADVLRGFAAAKAKDAGKVETGFGRTNERLTAAELNMSNLLSNIARYPKETNIGTLNVARAGLAGELKIIKNFLSSGATREIHTRFDALEKSLFEADAKLRALPLTDSDRLSLEGLGYDNIQKLAKYGINVSWDKVNKKPFIDISKVYPYIVEGETFTALKPESSFPLDKYEIKNISEEEKDGVIVFHVINKASSVEQKIIFSKTKEINIDPRYFHFYE